MDEAHEAPRGSGKPFGIAFVVVICAAIALTLILRQSVQQAGLVGRPAPPIRAAGWLNGPGPTDEGLKGKVIVVEAWAFWCGPCRMAAPEMVALYTRYSKQGVVFIGLTTEGKEYDAENRKFLEATRITWPNGYGAVETLNALKADFIPRRWVINRKNMLIWEEGSRQSIEAAIDHALKEQS